MVYALWNRFFLGNGLALKEDKEGPICGAILAIHFGMYLLFQSYQKYFTN